MIHRKLPKIEKIKEISAQFLFQHFVITLYDKKKTIKECKKFSLKKKKLQPRNEDFS